MIPIDPPEGVREIARVLEAAGFETWCVGGAIRDALLGGRNLDWDLATAATPAEVQRLFRRTVPVGIRFGTVGVLDRQGRMHEVTTFRRDVETDGRHAVVRFGASLEEDLARRDFTINAIAYSPARDELRDPFDGQGDLARRVVRTVGDAEDRMEEDRLRALRAIRFATRFGFEVEPATWRAIASSAPFLGRLSAERVRQELEKTMEQVARPSEAMRLWAACGAFATTVPALDAVDPEGFRALDHLAKPTALRRPARRLNRMTALFLDVPASRLPETLRALRFSNSDAGWITTSVRNWQTLGESIAAGLLESSPPSAREVRVWVSRAGRLGIGTLLRIASAVWSGRREQGVEGPSPERVASLYRRATRSAYRDPVEIADLAVDGEDLVRAGVPPGPRIGAVLRRLLDLVVEDPARNTQAQLIAAATAPGPDEAPRS